MFPPALQARTFLTTLYLSASALNFIPSILAAPSLALSISGPKYVSSPSRLSVYTNVTNTGDTPLRLLNDPRGTLRSTPTNTFLITSDDTGATPLFTGVRLKYVPERVAKRNVSSSFVVLAPGDSVGVEHDLSSAYDFTPTGSGTYTIEPSNLFLHLDSDSGNVLPIYADTTTDGAHTATLTGPLSSSELVGRSLRNARRGNNLNKRIGYQACSQDEQDLISSAADAAQVYAQNAYEYLSTHNTSNGTGSSPRYTTWFGTFTNTRHNAVLAHYRNELSPPSSSSNSSSSSSSSSNSTSAGSSNSTSSSNSTTSQSVNAFQNYTYDCTCDEEDVFAYVYPDEFGTIYLCNSFWEADMTGTDSMAGTLIHETSHFTLVAGTEDYAYGHEACQELATRNPSRAVENADSHEYFAENAEPELA